MKLALAFILALLPALAGAQELSAKLTPQEWQIVGDALGEAPFKKVAPIVQKLQKQLSEQQQQKPTAPPPEKPDAGN